MGISGGTDSGALMSVQGVFNTEVTKTDQSLGIDRVGTAFCVCGMRGSVAFYRTAEHWSTLAN